MADSKKYNGSTWEHSLRKLTTATDTITTLPADVYADGNNATVGLVGNMSQTGTPTQDNPIMPQGTGDLETSGAKAGQYKIPISSGSTTTHVYLGEVETTRKIKKLVLTGEEASWQSASASEGRNRFTLPILNAMQADTAHFTSLSSHLQLGVAGATWNTDDVYTITSSKIYMRLTAQYNSLSDFKSYLQQQYANGTPVCVWYVLATPTTGIVNEPLMRIGDYADTVSGITIPTITDKDTFDVLTTLKPSEVDLTYTGWHDAQCREYDGSQWV